MFTVYQPLALDLSIHSVVYCRFQLSLDPSLVHSSLFKVGIIESTARPQTYLIHLPLVNCLLCQESKRDQNGYCCCVESGLIARQSEHETVCELSSLSPSTPLQLADWERG